jgi:F0F1-type ATP synthase assembly protein I
MKPQINPSNKYISWGTQLFAGILIVLFGGKKLDEYLGFNKPVFTIIFPLIYLTGMMIKLIKETGNKNNKK